MSATVAVREHGLPMSGPLIAPTMDGRKTQTRRLYRLERINEAPGEWAFDRWQDGYKDGRRRAVFIDTTGEPVGIACPYGQAGDRLWVRETWDGPFQRLRMEKPSVLYRADLRDGETYPAVERWHPSIHMPRWASRITLELTDVRVERIQSIPSFDIRAEGLTCPVHDFPGGFCTSECPALRGAFRRTWDSLNAKRGYGWERNPWVWVLSFRRIAQ